MKKLITVALAAIVCCASFASDSVWKDCVLHIRGGHDRNGDGFFQANPGNNDYASGTTEVPDVRHEAQANPQSNKIRYRGESGTARSLPSEVRHSVTDVVSAAQGVTLKDQPCLYFPAGNYMDGSTQMHYPGSFLLWDGITSSKGAYPITGNKFTVLARVNVESLTSWTKTDDTCSWFWGTTTSGGEIRIGFRKKSSYNELPYVNVALGTATYPEQANVNAALDFGEWDEVAVVFDGDAKTVRVSCGRPGKLRRWGNISAGDFSLKPTGSMYLGAVRKDAQTYNDSFRGLVHTFAMWNRALSDEEVMEAFGGPAGNLVRIGEEGCTQDLYVGATATSEVTLDQTATDQRDWPASVGKGAVLKMPFAVDPYRAGLNQVLRLLPQAESGAGEFDVTVDGNRVGRIQVRARTLDGAADPSFFFVKGSLLSEGAHTLVLTRADNGLAPVRFDVIELGGSWRAGLVDGKSSPSTTDTASCVGITPFDGADTWYPASQNQADFVYYTCKRDNLERQKRIVWRVPDGFSAKVTCKVTANKLWADETYEHAIVLNGKELGRVLKFPSDGQSYTIATGGLSDGLNEFRCHYPAWQSGGTPWVAYDAFTCEVTDCVSDKVKFGLVICIR